MNILRLSGITAVMLLSAGLLTGCAPLFPEELSQAPEPEDLAPVPWLIAAQGEEKPQVCQEDLSRTEVRKEAKEALKEEEEAQELKDVLASMGKRLFIWRAKGCMAKADDAEEASSQGLWA